VVCTDEAIYPKGNARPTGGAGAIAMLIGKNASLVMDKIRASYMENTYDFYKPVMSSEYPLVDGEVSLKCYLRALDRCYSLLKKKNVKESGIDIAAHTFDFICCHTPFSKMSEKAFYKLYMNEIRDCPEKFPDLFNKLKDLEFSYANRTLQAIVQSEFLEKFKAQCEPTLKLSKDMGNLYTGSLYLCLLSLCSQIKGPTSIGKKILMYSYGSGLCSSMYVLHINNDLAKLRSFEDLVLELGSRVILDPVQYGGLMDSKEALYSVSFVPKYPLEHLNKGIFYLVEVDSKMRRIYNLNKVASSNKPVSTPEDRMKNIKYMLAEQLF